MLEMTVGGQNVGDVVTLHDNHRHTIDVAVFLVEARFVKCDCAKEQCARAWKNDDGFVR